MNDSNEKQLHSENMIFLRVEPAASMLQHHNQNLDHQLPVLMYTGDLYWQNSWCCMISLMKMTLLDWFQSFLKLDPVTSKCWNDITQINYPWKYLRILKYEAVINKNNYVINSAIFQCINDLFYCLMYVCYSHF